MQYEFINDDATILGNLITYLPSAPETFRAQLLTIVTTGVNADKMSAAPELLYDHYAELSDEGKVVLAQMCAYGSQHCWTTLNVDGRWDKIVLAVRRDLGEAGDWPAAEDDPKPRSAPALPEIIPAPTPD